MGRVELPDGPAILRAGPDLLSLDLRQCSTSAPVAFVVNVAKINLSYAL